MKKHFYLIHIQYLGFRYHGWMEQPGQLTVQKMINKTLQFVLGHDDFKTLGSSRTDSKVSANEMAFELFVKQELHSEQFLNDFNLNLPPDISALRIEKVDENFNIIQAPRLKEYMYLFSFGEKPHPFAAPLLSNFPGRLDIELMKKGAQVLEGFHNFINYSVKASDESVVERELITSEIVRNELYTASFFPEESFAYRVCGEGFGRYQVRMMMGQLVQLGMGNISLEQVRESLTAKLPAPLKNIAPASGLILHQLSWPEL